MITKDYPVVLFTERGLDRSHAEQVAALFDQHPGPINVRVVPKTVELRAGDDGLLRWDDAFVKMCEVRKSENVKDDEFIYLLTKTANESNLYAVQDPQDMRNGFGHVADFSWATSAPDHMISSHFLLKGIFNALLMRGGLNWTEFCHESPRGCLYDFCTDKRDLALKLRTADICGDCMEIFHTIGIPEPLLAQTIDIMETTRRAALNTGKFLPAEPRFAGWPFPVAITRHKAVQATNPLLRFMLLLDHFDSLVRFFFLAHEIQSGRTPILEDRPSLGWWVEQLAHSLKGARHFKEVVTIASQEKVVSMRNEKRGHGWMSANEDAYRTDAERLETVLNAIEEELRPFLDKCRLVILRQVQLKDGGFVVDGEQLLGSHMLHPTFSLKLKSDPRTLGLEEQGRVYLTDPSMQSFKPMYPYIRNELCPTCNHPRVLITDGGRQFIDAFMGHRVTL